MDSKLCGSYIIQMSPLKSVE